MHLDAVPIRASRLAYLLRKTYRIGKNFRKRMLACYRRSDLRVDPAD